METVSMISPEPSTFSFSASSVGLTKKSSSAIDRSPPGRHRVDLRAVGQQRHGGRGGVEAAAEEVRVEDRVKAVLAVLRVAGGAPLLAAVEFREAVIPAARTLAEVAPERRHVADLRRGSALARRRRARGRGCRSIGVGGDAGERRERPDPRGRPGGDLVHPRDMGDRDDALRAVEAFLHPVEEVHAAGLDLRVPASPASRAASASVAGRRSVNAFMRAPLPPSSRPAPPGPTPG